MIVNVRSHSFYVYYNKLFYYKIDSLLGGGGIIIHRNDLRSFTSFVSVGSFVSWYLSVPVRFRCFDEVVVGSRKFILDLDCKDGGAVDWDLMLYYCRTQLMSHFLDPVIMVYDSHGFGVRSSHVVVTNYVMDCDTCYVIAESIVSSMPGDYARCVDMGVYKRMQFMRLEGSRKGGSGRYLYLSGSDRIGDMRLGMLSCVLEGSCVVGPYVREFCGRGSVRCISNEY